MLLHDFINIPGPEWDSEQPDLVGDIPRLN